VSSVVDTDPVIRQFRDQISDNDLKIVDAINKRLKLVARLRAYKEERGMDFVDPDREVWMLTYVSRANKGPLSPEGLREIYDHVLSLTKAELLREK
jgi:chorismate mutase